MSRSIRAIEAVACVAAASFFSACAFGPSGAEKRDLNAFIASGNYQGAQQLLERTKQSQYGRKNMVLYYLDLGTILHHEGQYANSDAAFDRAERRSEELYTKSLHQAAGTLLLNDTTMDYAARPYERALLNVFRALDYVFLGKPDEALVESRKVEQFLDELNRDLQNKPDYKDDAFARYLDSLLYADEGMADDARISRQAALAAYGWYASLFHTPTPHFEFPPGSEKSDGELVFIHYNGVAPRLVSRTWQVAWGRALILTRSSGDSEVNDASFQEALNAGIAGHAITVAYPDYVQDPYRIVSSQVEVDDGQASADTLLMEDVSEIARRDLTDRLPLIKLRAVARATVKYVLAEAASRAAGAECDKQYGAKSMGAKFCRALAGGLAHGLAAATEVADTRSWSTLPAQIRMARLRLAPGRHKVVVRFMDAAGVVVSTAVFNDVVISQSKRTYLAYRTAS